MGFALAAGVLIDAFAVRMTLISATMYLLGDRAWKIPRWLDKALTPSSSRPTTRYGASVPKEPNVSRSTWSLVAPLEIHSGANLSQAKQRAIGVAAEASLIGLRGERWGVWSEYPLSHRSKVLRTERARTSRKRAEVIHPGGAGQLIDVQLGGQIGLCGHRSAN